MLCFRYSIIKTIKQWITLVFPLVLLYFLPFFILLDYFKIEHIQSQRF